MIISPSGMMQLETVITSQVQSSFIALNLQKHGNVEITNQDTKELRSYIGAQKMNRLDLYRILVIGP